MFLLWASYCLVVFAGSVVGGLFCLMLDRKIWGPTALLATLVFFPAGLIMGFVYSLVLARKSIGWRTMIAGYVVFAFAALVCQVTGA